MKENGCIYNGSVVIMITQGHPKYWPVTSNQVVTHKWSQRLAAEGWCNMNPRPKEQLQRRKTFPLAVRRTPAPKPSDEPNRDTAPHLRIEVCPNGTSLSSFIYPEGSNQQKIREVKDARIRLIQVKDALKMLIHSYWFVLMIGGSW